MKKASLQIIILFLLGCNLVNGQNKTEYLLFNGEMDTLAHHVVVATENIYTADVLSDGIYPVIYYFTEGKGNKCFSSAPNEDVQDFRTVFFNNHNDFLEFLSNNNSLFWKKIKYEYLKRNPGENYSEYCKNLKFIIKMVQVYYEKTSQNLGNDDVNKILTYRMVLKDNDHREADKKMVFSKINDFSKSGCADKKCWFFGANSHQRTYVRIRLFTLIWMHTKNTDLKEQSNYYKKMLDIILQND